jgi:DNA-binding transcriptional LysR family regulator
MIVGASQCIDPCIFWYKLAMDESTALTQDLLRELRLKDLVFLQRIGESRSLSAAASELRVTQPAASRWLRDLEQLFRAHLFTRDRMTGMQPTPLGALILDRSRALVADVALLSSDLEAQRTARGARLQLGVIPYVSTRMLEHLVSRLVIEHRMTVSIVEGATEPLVESLRMQRLHAVIGRCGTSPPTGGLRQETLFTQKACLIFHPKYPIGHTAPKLTSLMSLRWVVPPGDSPTWQAVVAALAAVKLHPPRATVETASTKFVHALVSAHEDMVAVLPHDIGQEMELLGGVRVVPFPAVFKMPPVGLLAPTRHWQFSHVVALRNTLRSLVAHDERFSTRPL